MKLAAALGMAFLLAACDVPERAPVAVVDHSPQWAVDPAVPGSDTPSAGRSLFDYAMTGEGNAAAYDIPPTFPELVERIEQRLGCKTDCSRQVLIPLGRSLQRTAASPGFFSSPRVVVAFTGEGEGPLAGRDLVYLGFQRRAGTIEVISYNEAIGRFEFQLVTGYKANGTPQVVYAKRSVCVACHQNQGPIFSRQVWDETNANPRVAAMLNEANPMFEGVPVEVPNAIDDATERANLVAVTQRLWADACDAACRRAAVLAALQFRLSGDRGFEREPLARAISAGMRARFPDGLAVPNPDIPNRNPLDFPAGTTARAQSHIPGPLEALVPRMPIDVWRAGDAELPHRFVTGIAHLLSAADVRKVDRRLAEKAPAERIYRASCTIVAGDPTMPFDCQGEVTLKGNDASLSMIAIGDAAPLRNLVATNVVRKKTRLEFMPRGGNLRARLANGDAITRVVVQAGADGAGEAEVSVTEDAPALRDPLALVAFPEPVLRRSAVMAVVDTALGIEATPGCCADAVSLPAAQSETVAATNALPPEAAAFQQPCGVCHAGAQASPPNFLMGDAKRVSALLAHCAPRIYVRLAMWDSPADLRGKVPMPPPQASRAGHPWVQDAAPEVVAPLRNAVAGWLRAETGREPDLSNLLMHGYENLRTCLPAGA